MRHFAGHHHVKSVGYAETAKFALRSVDWGVYWLPPILPSPFNMAECGGSVLRYRISSSRSGSP